MNAGRKLVHLNFHIVGIIILTVEALVIRIGIHGLGQAMSLVYVIITVPSFSLEFSPML